MRLRLHPDCRCAAVSAIDVAWSRPQPTRLLLDYAVHGAIGGLSLPPARSSGRSEDDLWRHTCLEALVAARGGYYEFNFAPSGRWAAYRFDGYRLGKRLVPAAPKLDLQADETCLRLRVELDFPDDATGRLGLAAVIEEADGRLSYWALRHPPGKPDFHHADCFALELPGA